MATRLFDSSGENDLRVPGFHGMSLNYTLPYGERFAHSAKEWCQLPGITARELAMTEAINLITDKHDWYRHIDDKQQVLSWEEEVREQHDLISDKAWEWCLSELRDKARDYKQKRFVRVLDTGSCVCKSDELLGSTLAASFKTELDPLFAMHRLYGSTYDLVDPYMFPLTFGRTRFLTRGCVRLGHSDAKIEAMFTSEAHTTLTGLPTNTRTDLGYVDALCQDSIHTRREARFHSLEKPQRYFWSTTAQCLPCDVQFCGSGTSVRITSYVNNLHPHHQSVYTHLEDVMAAAIKMWNECLISGPKGWRHCSRVGSQQQRGGFPLRIITDKNISDHVYRTTLHECEIHKQQAKYRREARAVDDILENHPKKYRLDPYWRSRALAKSRLNSWPKLADIKTAQEISQEILQIAEDVLDLEFVYQEPEDSLDGVWDDLEDEVEHRSQWRQPEPGEFFSYDKWRAGNRRQSKSEARSLQTSYQPLQFQRTGPIRQPRPVRLEQEFMDEGLQTIIGISEIPLGPGERYEKDWQLEGHLNEHIVASAIYAYDVSNVDCTISFRQETPAPFNIYKCNLTAGDSSKWPLPHRQVDCENLADLMAAEICTSSHGTGSIESSMQITGSISMPQNRLIAFPNVAEHCIEASTVDASRTGYIRCIALHLVDPHYRICSTRNVPPQQSAWWEIAITRVLLNKLPMELIDLILEHCTHLMSEVEAEEIRAQMIREQQWFMFARHAGDGRPPRHTR